MGLIYEPSSLQEALRQGEILSDLMQPIVLIESMSPRRRPVFDLLHHPLAIIISQDCDLDLEFRARNGLPSPDNKPLNKQYQLQNVLFCELHLASQVLSIGVNADTMRRITPNNHERFQYLRAIAPDEDAQGQGFGSLVADFKRCFTIRADEVYAQLGRTSQRHWGNPRRRCRLKSPYLEQVADRFSHYMSRVALPEEH